MRLLRLLMPRLRGADAPMFDAPLQLDYDPRVIQLANECR